MRYLYSVVRFVPSPATGEYVNIGAIAGSDETGDWSLRQAGNPRRARLFGPLESLNAVNAFMNEIGSRIDRHALMQSDEVSEGWLRDLHRRHRNVVQLSRPAPVIAESAEEALELVLSQAIPEDQGLGATARGYTTRLRLFSELRASYRRVNIPPSLLRERISVSAGGLSAPMDFVVGNGTALQLTHTWSFQIQSTDEVAKDVKSWGFTVERLLRHGGTVAGENSPVVPPGAHIDVVVAPPLTLPQEAAYEEATKVFDDLGVHAVPETRAADVASEARDRLLADGIALDLF
ncbi:DUF3037 domain-containing protein [Symbioplanes lichenis]|uniref:DUF3037 domain-containing protein n=1 Tax=Symbioplanes lichenis TaxID=1629072 RepID=UPI002739AD7F|nr:DUF3037 domain-containing protein [Actinoplanes lichenis]